MYSTQGNVEEEKIRYRLILHKFNEKWSSSFPKLIDLLRMMDDFGMII
jgi:hypothetical protein